MTGHALCILLWFPSLALFTVVAYSIGRHRGFARGFDACHAGWTLATQEMSLAARVDRGRRSHNVPRGTPKPDPS